LLGPDGGSLRRAGRASPSSAANALGGAVLVPRLGPTRPLRPPWAAGKGRGAARPAGATAGGGGRGPPGSPAPPPASPPPPPAPPGPPGARPGRGRRGRAAPPSAPARGASSTVAARAAPDRPGLPRLPDGVEGRRRRGPPAWKKVAVPSARP